MSLYGPTFHVTPVDLCIIFQSNIYILYHVLWKLNCFKLFQGNAMLIINGLQ